MNYFGEIPVSVLHAKVGTMPGCYLKVKGRRLPAQGEAFEARKWPHHPGERWARYRVVAVQQNGLYLLELS